VPFLGIAHVQLAAPAGCEDAARRFFGELLGLEELLKPPDLAGRGGVWFRCGDQELHVGVERDFAPALKAHPALAVSAAVELDALATTLDAAGFEVRWDDAIAGVRRFYTADPWGNRVELLSPA
jgi:catechol 2,3-dioxygenase-like lactoylglutathione lyase family enzyme